MHITLEQARHVARLARLELSEEQLRQAAVDLGAVLEHVAVLDPLDTTGVPPAPYPFTLPLPLHADEPGPTLTPGEVLALAPESEAGCVRVPRVLSGEEGGAP